MRHLTRFSAPLVAALSLGFAACDSDESPKDDTTNPTDTDTSSPNDTDTTEETTDTVGDTTPNDPCDSNPCDTPPGPRCSDDGAGIVTSTGPGTCTASGATASCAYTESTAACGADKTCVGAVCVDEGNACDYEFDARVSYVTEIKVVKSDNCCFDFNDDNKNDNKLGDLLAQVGTLVPNFDVNVTIQEQIADGGLVLLLETKNVTDISNSTNVTINGFYGADADENLENNAAGTSAFVANPSSFAPNTASPLISFPNASISSGVLTAGPSIFRLSFPLLGATLDLAISGTRFEAPVAAGALGADKGLALGGTDGAKLGGYLAMRDFATAFNTYLDAQCTCIAKNNAANPYVMVNTGAASETVAINIKNGTDCTGEDESTCKQVGDALGQYGAILGTLLTPDLDANDDGVKESLSVGVRLTATSGSVDGVAECPAR